MRNIDPLLKTHLETGVTSTCTCWVIRRLDGVVTGFTDHDQLLSIECVDCEAASGFQPTEAVAELGLSSDHQEIEGALSSAALFNDDLIAGRFDNAQVEVWLVNWAQPEQRHLMRTALLGEISREDGLFRAELRGFTSLLEQKTGRTISRRCDAVVGDTRCGVDLNEQAHQGLGTVVSIAQRLILRCTGLEAFEPGWFVFGNLTWTTGRNMGLSVEITAGTIDSNDELHLWKAMPFLPQMGDSFLVTTGCDKSFAICKEKFANHQNFRGFPHVPGSDFALGYADSSSIHDGRPLVD